MGCDIHSWVEVKNSDNKWVYMDRPVFDGSCEPFDWRQYGMFAFFNDVRNYSIVPDQEWWNRGLPEDSEYLNSKPHWDNSYDTLKDELESDYDWHSHGHIYLKELVDFDYSQTFEDRRTCGQTGPNSWNGALLAEEGKGEITTYQEFLGRSYFDDFEILKTLESPENVRIVFFFDN